MTTKDTKPAKPTFSQDSGKAGMSQGGIDVYESDTNSQSTTEADPHEDRPKYTAEQLDRAEVVLHRFWRWREDNPSAWKFAEALALDKAAQGQRVSSRMLIEAIRGRDFATKDGQPTQTDNSYATVLGRVLAAEHPEISPHLERRRSAFDVLLGG